MKTFRDFILETKKYTRTRSREDAEKFDNHKKIQILTD